MSKVDPSNRLMEMHSKNLTFCRYVNMEEKMIYTPDPEDVDKTLLRQEMIVTVQGVPLTSYMESIIVNTVSNNSSKGKAAIDWVVEKLGQECRWEDNIICYVYSPSLIKILITNILNFTFFQGSKFVFFFGQAEKRNSRPKTLSGRISHPPRQKVHRGAATRFNKSY